MSDAPFPSTSFSQAARGGAQPPDRAVANFDRPGTRVSLPTADHEVCAKRRAPLTDDEIQSIANRLRRYSRRSPGDLALFYLMLTTGAKPLELARLRVQDVIAASGAIRSEARIPAIAAINGVERPIYLKSEVAVDATLIYLQHRVARGQGAGNAPAFAGLDPVTPLLLNHQGRPYEIVESSGNGGNRYLCRGILETCRRVFRLSGIPGLCGSTIRRTLARRLSDRGATIEQIGEALGIKDRKAIRDLLDLHPIALPTLFDEIVCQKGTTAPAVDPR